MIAIAEDHKMDSSKLSPLQCTIKKPVVIKVGELSSDNEFYSGCSAVDILFSHPVEVSEFAIASLARKVHSGTSSYIVVKLCFKTAAQLQKMREFEITSSLLSFIFFVQILMKFLI